MGRRHTYFFLGVDSAPSETRKSDDGALIAGVAQPRQLPEHDQELSTNEADWHFDLIFGRVFNSKEKLSARQWSGYIHQLHRRFSFEKIVLDAGAGGGGVFVKRELMELKQLINGAETIVTPLGDQVDAPRRLVNAEFIVHMFKRGDPGIELVWPNAEDSSKSLAGDELLKGALFGDFQEAIRTTQIGFPPLMREWMSERKEEVLSWPEERLWALKILDALTEQLKNIIVAKKEDGTYLFTRRGAHVFTSVGRDDIALAAMFAYAAFRIWLKSGSWEGGSPDDEEGFGH